MTSTVWSMTRSLLLLAISTLADLHCSNSKSVQRRGRRTRNAQQYACLRHLLPGSDGSRSVCWCKVSMYACMHTHARTHTVTHTYTARPHFLQVCEQTGSGVSGLCGSVHHGHLCRSYQDSHRATGV